ncbi:unnamed protein product [Echinostoma caproni]|uniref:Uncharacterized protein n=1 Tax=Echinostoma caproni TaxID=27848 RepID=A0A3P8GXZ5_9TREM|nr:unnamed protein product [Echinostoma caproni]
MDGVQFGDRVRADTAWICSQAVILSGMRLPNSCFIGPSTEDGGRITLGPGPGRLVPRSVIVSPGPNDVILDPAVGGSRVWAALCTDRSDQVRF